MRGRARLVYSAVTVGGLLAAFVAPSAGFTPNHPLRTDPGTIRVSTGTGPTAGPGRPDDRTYRTDAYRATLVDFAAVLGGAASVAPGGPLTTTAVASLPAAPALPAPTPAPPAPPARPAGLPAPAMAATDGALGGVWSCIRAHESGGNYAADTGNGYYGAYQFSEATWVSVGGSGHPDDAPPAAQDAMALRLQQRSGWHQWSTHARCGV